MKAMVASSQDDVKTHKLMQSLAKEGDMEKILHDIGPDSKAKDSQLDKLRDVTADFMAPAFPYGPELPPSPIQLYKGLIRRLAETCPVEKENTLAKVSVLAGREQRVQEVMLGGSVMEVMENQDVERRWEDSKYEVLGMVAWCPGGHEVCESQLEQLWNAQDHLLLLVMAGMEFTQAWIAERDANSGKLSYRAVSVDKTGMNRQKGDNFVVLPASQIAVSLKDQALFDKSS